MESTLYKLPNQLNTSSSDQKSKECLNPGMGGGVYVKSFFLVSLYFLSPAPQELLQQT